MWLTWPWALTGSTGDSGVQPLPLWGGGWGRQVWAWAQPSFSLEEGGFEDRESIRGIHRTPPQPR